MRSESLDSTGGSDLVLLTTRDLLKLVEDLGSNHVSATTLAESEKILESHKPDWNLSAYVALISSLESEGYGDRAAVIRAAARQDGNFSREEVYRIAGINEEDRSLRQFATPVQRLTRELEESGMCTGTLPKALKAMYDGPGETTGYEVPPEFVEFDSVFTEAEELLWRDKSPDWSSREQIQAQTRTAVRRFALAHGSVDSASQIAESLMRRTVRQMATTDHESEGTQ